MSNVEMRLKELGLELPPTRKPIGEYVGSVRVGNLLFVSGHGPIQDQERIFIGKVGAEFDLDLVESTVLDGRTVKLVYAPHLHDEVPEGVGPQRRITG